MATEKIKAIGVVLLSLAILGLFSTPLFMMAEKMRKENAKKVSLPVLSSPLTNGELVYEVGQRGTIAKVKVYYFIYRNQGTYLVVNEYNGGVAIK
jgi:hypothetical protein